MCNNNRKIEIGIGNGGIEDERLGDRMGDRDDGRVGRDDGRDVGDWMGSEM